MSHTVEILNLKTKLMDETIQIIGTKFGKMTLSHCEPQRQLKFRIFIKSRWQTAVI